MDKKSLSDPHGANGGSRAPGLETLAETERAAAAVTRVLDGDVEAFRTLVEAHEGAVLGLCSRLVHGDRVEAEDLTQETFIRAYRYLPKLEDRNRFAPWLFQIARSLCRERLRRFKAERRALVARVDMLRWAGPTRADPEGSPAIGGGESLSLALDDLPPDERKVLLLRYFDGLSYEEIAARMQVTFSRVDHLIREARARLARRLTVRQRLEHR